MLRHTWLRPFDDAERLAAIEDPGQLILSHAREADVRTSPRRYDLCHSSQFRGSQRGCQARLWQQSGIAHSKLRRHRLRG